MTDWRPTTRQAVRLAEVQRARQLLAKSVSEAEWQAQVVQLAHALGWRHLHVRRSIGKGKRWVTATNIAWPDLWLWKPEHGFVALELKVGSNRPTPEQSEVLADLAAAGARTMVAYPGDLEAVRDLLAGREVA